MADVALLRAVLEADSSKADAVLTAYEQRLNALGQKAFPAAKVTAPDLSAQVSSVNALAAAYDNLARAQARAARPPAGSGSGGWGSAPGRRTIERMEQSGYRNLQVGARLTSTFTDPLVDASKGILDYSANFEEAMQHVITLTDVGRGELEGLKRAVVGLAADPSIRKGPAELAEALYYVTSTGRKGAEGLQILRASALGASAGLGETKVVANTLTTVLDAYGLSGDKAAKSVDTLTQAVKFGKGEADKFAGAFPKVIAIAAQAGVSFEEVAAQMASATRVGLTPSETATALRQIFNNLIDPSEKAKRAMKELGTSVEEVRLKLREKGLFNTLKELSERTGGRIGPITELFGNIRALTGFLSTTGESTLASYQQTLSAINNGQGATLTAAATASETFRFQLDKLRSTAEATAITIGTKYLPAINKMARSGSVSIGALPGAWARLSEAEKSVIKLTAGLLAMAGPLNLVLGNVKILYGLFTSMASLGGLLAPVAAFLANPVVVAVLAGTALIGGLALWSKFTTALEEAKAQSAALAQNARTLDQSLSKATAGTTNPKVRAILAQVQKAVTDAGDDAGKLQRALDLALNKKREIQALGLAPNAADPLLAAVDRTIKAIEQRRIHLGVEVNAPTAETTRAMEELRGIYARQSRAFGIQAGIDHALDPSYSAHLDRSLAHNRDNLRELLRLQDEYNRKSRGDVVSDFATGHAAPQRRAWAPGAADVEAIGRINARVKDLQEQGHQERLKAQRLADERAADAAKKRQEQEQANAERLRAIQARSLQDQIAMWQAYAGAVEGAMGRIVGVSEQATVVGEKTARARVEAELLRSVYADVPEPLKQVLLELGSIEAKMKQIAGMRDALRDTFESSYKTLLQAGLDPGMVRGGARAMEREMGLARQLDTLQRRAYGIGTSALNTAEGNRAGLDAQKEAMSFAGTKAAQVFEGGASVGAVAAGKKVSGTMLRSLVEEFNAKSPRSLGASCADVASNVLNAIGHNLKYSANAATLERNAKAAGWVRVPVGTAGSLNVQSGPGFGKISGHHVTVGLGNGMVGSSSGYRTSYHGLRSGNPRAYLPPSSLGGASPSGTVTSPTGVTVPTVGASTGARPAAMPPLLPADGRLLRYSSLPAAWGGNVFSQSMRENEQRTAREAMQALILEQGSQGVGFGSRALKMMRRSASDVDLRLSQKAATDQAKKAIAENVRAMRQVGKVENPYVAFLEEVGRGLHDYVGAGTLQKQFKSILDRMQAEAGQATLEGAQKVYSERIIFDRGRKYLAGGDFYGANRAMERERVRRQIRESDIVRKEYENQAKDAPGANGDKLARTLTQQAWAGLDDEAGRKRMSEAARGAQEYAQQLAGVREQRSILLRLGGAPESLITEALQRASDEQEVYNGLVNEYGDAYARTRAQEEAGRRASVRELQREIDLQKARVASAREVADVEAAGASLRANGISPQGRIEREMDAWAREQMATRGSVDPLLAGNKRRSLQGQSANAAAEDALGRLSQLRQEQATLGDETGIAALKIEMQTGALQNLDAALKSQLLTETRLNAVRKAQVGTDEQVLGMEKDLALARATNAAQRFQIELDYQNKARKLREDASGTTRTPEMAAIEDSARARQMAIVQQSEAFSQLREMGDGLRGIIADSLHLGFEGIGAGIGSLAKRLRDQALDVTLQKVATRWTRKLLGEDSVEDVRSASILDGMRGHRSILDSIGGFAGGTMGDVLGAIGSTGAAGSAPASAQTINIVPQNVMVQAQSVSVTGAVVNVGSAGASTSGGPGSRPSGRQQAIGAIGALAGLLK